MGADSARNIVKHAVLNEDVFAVQILGAAVYNVLWVENIELDRLVAVVTGCEYLVAEGAALGGEAVAARDLHHVSLALVDDGYVLHGEVLCVGYLEHGVLALIAVEGAADELDVFVLITDGAAVYAVLAADAEHIARLCALQRNAAEVEGSVIVDMQTAAEAVAACRYLDGNGA